MGPAHLRLELVFLNLFVYFSKWLKQDGQPFLLLQGPFENRTSEYWTHLCLVLKWSAELEYFYTKEKHLYDSFHI
jgi:hypothetical protein